MTRSSRRNHAFTTRGGSNRRSTGTRRTRTTKLAAITGTDTAPVGCHCVTIVATAGGEYRDRRTASPGKSFRRYGHYFDDSRALAEKRGHARTRTQSLPRGQLTQAPERAARTHTSRPVFEDHVGVLPIGTTCPLVGNVCVQEKVVPIPTFRDSGLTRAPPGRANLQVVSLAGPFGCPRPETRFIFLAENSSPTHSNCREN